ncbi:MAG: cysteine--tRNA ligase [Candidatus Woesebacteria bacterium]
MKIFNTMSRTIEEIIPIAGKHIGLYACGLTVYDYTHIGHARKYSMDDVLVRTLKHSGLDVQHVQNVTDVGHLVSDADEGEDKMEKGARKYGKTVWDVAKEFEDFFWKSMDAMGLHRPDISSRATDHIPEQIELVQRLEKNGLTYTIADGVYFDTSKFPNYGALARLDKDALKAGARVEMVAGKKNLTDFALWKFSPKDEKRQMEWDSPWGKGFPGWHIECSAMAMKYLGDQFEIHTGGIDHIPVHHPNEIAQAEGATGKSPFVKYWVHHNFLQVEGEKMSKSLGNIYTVDDVIAKGFDPMALKLLFFGSHYRSELNFTWDNLAATQKSYDKLIGILCQAKQTVERTTLSSEKLGKVNEYRKRFFEQMENDLHTPEAMSVFWEVAKSSIPGSDKYDLLIDFDSVLGLGLAKACSLMAAKKEDDIPSGVQMLVDQREAARVNKDFATSDMLRDEIAKLGWTVEDSSEGQKVKKSL